MPGNAACLGSNSVGDPCNTNVTDGCNSTTACGPCVGGTLVCNGTTCCQPGTVASLCGNSDSAGDPCNTTPSNGCGGTVSCGDCSAGPPGLVCNGGTCCNSNCGPNDCGDKTICGVARSCGACGGGQQCNAGLCCAPRTCAVNYPNRCGSLTDNCGGNVSCSCSGLRSCSATNCLCPAPDVGATHPGVVAGGFCTGLCQVQKWIGTDGSSATLRDLGTGASPSPNYVDACKITCNDCGGGGG